MRPTDEEDEEYLQEETQRAEAVGRAKATAQEETQSAEGADHGGTLSAEAEAPAPDPQTTDTCASDAAFAAALGDSIALNRASRTHGQQQQRPSSEAATANQGGAQRSDTAPINKDSNVILRFHQKGMPAGTEVLAWLPPCRCLLMVVLAGNWHGQARGRDGNTHRYLCYKV